MFTRDHPSRTGDIREGWLTLVCLRFDQSELYQIFTEMKTSQNVVTYLVAHNTEFVNFQFWKIFKLNELRAVIEKRVPPCWFYIKLSGQQCLQVTSSCTGTWPVQWRKHHQLCKLKIPLKKKSRRGYKFHFSGIVSGRMFPRREAWFMS